MIERVEAAGLRTPVSRGKHRTIVGCIGDENLHDYDYECDCIRFAQSSPKNVWARKEQKNNGFT